MWFRLINVGSCVYFNKNLIGILFNFCRQFMLNKNPYDKYLL